MTVPSRLTSAAREAATALALIAIAIALTFVGMHFTAAQPRVYAFLFLVAIIASASRGYVGGIVACLLSFSVAPYIFLPHFKITSVEPTRLLMTVAIAMLISAFVSTRRGSEQRLRRINEDLDARVKDRTAALEAANRELAHREEQLNLTKAQLNDVLDSVSESFLALDREWRFTYVNRRILDSLGRPPEQVLGHSIWEVFPEAVQSDFYPQYHRAMNERISVRFEMEYPSSASWFDVTAHPTKEGISAFVVDITQRKKDEAAVGRLASIVESSSDAIVGKNLEGTILSWNNGAERIYGFSCEEAVGQSMNIVVPESHRAEERDILDRLGRGERVDHFETLRVRKDGTQIDVSLTISPVRNRDGQIIGASHVARDVTDQKTFQSQFQQVQKLESLGILAGGIAHDFNNLLVGILGNASLVYDNAKPENQPLLAQVIAAGERAADLTSQLLAYAGKGRFFIQSIDLSDLVREISRLIKASIAGSVALHLDLASDLSPIEGDSGQIQQIVMNLVINASEAVGETSAGTVTVKTRQIEADEHTLASRLGGKDLTPGSYIMLEVSDTGFGMSEETLARIFDPFFTTKFTGRGLGLSAVLGIVGSHKGVLKVNSALGKGTTFQVLLPASRVATLAPLKVTAPKASLKGAGSVLVVDDEEIVRKVARGCLERYGYNVAEARDGRAAVEILRQNPSAVSLIILDLTMPVMGGEEALSFLRRIRVDVPIILSSGYSEMEALRRFEGKGIAGFIQKPYTASQLAAKVKASLEPVSVAHAL